MLEDFFRAYLKDEVAARPKLIGSADSARFFDHPQPALSLIGLATIAGIERIVGRQVDPLRFRANVYLSGVPAWAELDWVGKEISIGIRSRAYVCSHQQYITIKGRRTWTITGLAQP